MSKPGIPPRSPRRQKKCESSAPPARSSAHADDSFLVGYFLVHLFEHTLAPHFHFGEETHFEEMSHQHARTSVLVGLTIHTFFDGVAIAAGFLVSTWLGAVMFFAVFLHKLPEGFTVASVVLASGQGKRNAILAAGLL